MPAPDDESTAYVAIFDKAFTVSQVKCVGELKRTGTAGVRDGDYHVDLEMFPFALDLFCQALSHMQTSLVYGDAIDHRVRACQVNIFENAGRQYRRFCTLPRIEVAIHVYEYRLARRHIAQQFEPEYVQYHALGGNHIFSPVFRFQFADNQGADAKRVAEGQHAIVGDHGDYRIGTTATAMHTGHGIEHHIHVQHRIVCGLLDFMRQHVKQNFRIGIGIDMAQILAKHLALELLGVGQVAIVSEHNTKRRVDIEWLRFGSGGTACGRIAHMRYTGST